LVAAEIAKTINDNKAAQRQLEELKCQPSWKIKEFISLYTSGRGVTTEKIK